MCYDVAYLTKKAESYAKKYGSTEDWEDIKKRLPPTWHASGFDEPTLPALINEEPEIINMLDWSFIPQVYAPKVNGRPMNTLNARDDKIFSRKSVYYPSAIEKRCLIPLDGFFDHHKKNGVAFPFFIRMKDRSPFMVAGLWQELEKEDIGRRTVTLVTTRANKEMAWIHNEPAYSPESRMIYIVPETNYEKWLFADPEEAKSLITPLPDDMLEYHSCHPVKSNKKLNRTYPGNKPLVQEHKRYPELETQQGSLF